MTYFRSLAAALLVLVRCCGTPAFADSQLPFSPSPGGTTKITANATPSSVSGSLTNASAGNRVRICNAGTVLGFARLGATAPTATAADLPVLAASCIIVELGPNTFAAVISSTTTADDFYFTIGEGGQ